MGTFVAIILPIAGNLRGDVFLALPRFLFCDWLKDESLFLLDRPSLEYIIVQELNTRASSGYSTDSGRRGCWVIALGGGIEATPNSPFRLHYHVTYGAKLYL